MMTSMSWELAPSITLEQFKLSNKESPYKMTNSTNKDVLGLALVSMAHSDNGIGLLLQSTLCKFHNMIGKLQIENKTKFLKFGKCVKGTYKNNWGQVFNDDFPEATSPSYDKEKHDRSKDELFTNAIHSIIKKSPR